MDKIRNDISHKPESVGWLILHDALWVEAPIGEAKEARGVLERAMKHAVEMPSMPLEVKFD